MAPRDWGLWMHAKFVRQLCPELFTSASEAYSRLQEAKMMLHNSGANFNTPCAGGSRHACELPRQLKQWNRVFAPINIQLRERNAPGELALLFLDVPWKKRDLESRIQRALLLLHYLLTKHCCVTAFRVDDWGVLKCPENLTLFCDVLSECRSLKSLKLCVEHPYARQHQRLLAAICDLSCLEEFACGGALYPADEPGNATSLCSVVARDAKLSRLARKPFYCMLPGTGHIAKVLGTNATITDLYLDLNCLRANEIDLFSQALKEKRPLKWLRLVGSIPIPTLSVATIAAAAEGLTSLITLELSNFRVTTSEAWALAMSLSCSKTVQQLALPSCRPVFSYKASAECTGDDSDRGLHWRMQPFLHMLREATSLRKLAFPVCAFPEEDQRAFFEALAANGLIEEVLIENPSAIYPRELCRLICETGTGSRVVIDTVRVDERSLDSSSKGPHIRDVRVLDDESAGPGEIHSWLAQLPTFNTLTTLTVDTEFAIDAESAELLAQYIRTTQVLNDVTMYFIASRDDALVLLDALSHNNSIKTLVVEDWCQSKVTARILADIVSSSKSIRTLTYHLTSMNPSAAFFPALAKHIEGNRTILSVSAYRPTAAAQDWNFIQEVTARNRTLLVHAAQCVTGRAVTKSGAEALESLRSDHMLVAKVQEMASIDETEAKDAIRSRLADMDDLDFFMTVSGAVRERVVCQESAKGSPCLDTIPYDCWLLVRRYLRVADVVDTLKC